jgi:PAS domain S-box-containing protein
MLSQFFDSLPMAVFVLDEKGQPWFQNRPSVELLGAGKDGVPPEGLAIAYNAYVAGTDDIYPAHEVIARTLQGETVTLTDVEFEQGGHRVPVELRAAPVRDEAGRVTHALAAVMDITERKRAEHELMTARNAAEGANRAKSQFLARMSHELRTPLNSVIGFATILRKDKAANHNEQQSLYLDRIIANGKHLLALINDVLDLSKVEAGRMELDKSTVEVDRVVREVVQSFEGQARERGLGLEMDIPATVATVETDAMRFKQVLINLVGNALKFTEQGGVTVRLVVDPANALPTRIEVEDTGVGIHPNRLNAIFQTFEQGERSTTRKFGGSGLGLSISQALCELLGCRIEVKSEMGVGSTFTLVLDGIAPAPARRMDDTSDVEADSSATASGSKKAKRVLIVDDEPDSRMLLAHQLEELGFEPLAAQSGVDGIRAARALAPDVILLDLKMPGMNGWDVIRKLKSERDLARIPVIVVSVIAAENRGSVMGALEYLNKPVAREDLFEVLERVLPNGGHGVLVIDDDEDMQRLLSDELTADYGPVWTAGDGEEALGVLRSLAPDVILLDLVMPGMDGFTFLERLRLNPRFAHTPVVVVSSKDLTRAEQEELAKRTSALIGKGEDLAERVRGAIERVLANPAEAL